MKSFIRVFFAFIAFLIIAVPAQAAINVINTGAASEILAAEEGTKKPKEGEEEAEPECD